MHTRVSFNGTDYLLIYIRINDFPSDWIVISATVMIVSNSLEYIVNIDTFKKVESIHERM